MAQHPMEELKHLHYILKGRKFISLLRWTIRGHLFTSPCDIGINEDIKKNYGPTLIFISRQLPHRQYVVGPEMLLNTRNR